MKRIVLLICCSFFFSVVQAQELFIKLLTAAPMDLSASQYERKDLAGQACGLVKVQLATPGAQFEGNVIGKADYKTGEYWVYMSEGSYMLSVKHPSFIPLSVNFRDYGITGIEGKATYKLTLLMPQTAAPLQTQKLTINYTPANAMVLVDSKLYEGKGRVELDLPVGNHSYIIAATGYESAEGTVKLTAGAPRTVTETLVASSHPVQQPVPETLQTTPIQQASAPQSSSVSGSAVERFTVDGVLFNMVRVDGGTFQMGATSEQGSDADDREKPAHQVTLSSYYIGETEVTQELWEAVMGSNPSTYKGAKHPVEKVSWNDCQDFIRKLNAKTGRQFRLPTEAEWEYAARGGRKRQGYKYSGSNTIDDVAWYTKTTNDKGTRDVKTKQANELGLYDMSGNALEWCEDWYGAYSSSSQSDPKGPSSGSFRVFRGGSWLIYARRCRVSLRYFSTPGSTFNFLGLRLAL